MRAINAKRKPRALPDISRDALGQEPFFDPMEEKEKFVRRRSRRSQRKAKTAPRRRGRLLGYTPAGPIIG